MKFQIYEDRGGGDGGTAPLTLSESMPMTETMPEALASAAACMLSPRSFTSRRPSSNLSEQQQGQGDGKISELRAQVGSVICHM